VTWLATMRAIADRVRQHIGIRSLPDDAGNAVLEFVVLSVFLMVPLIYIIIAVAQVQGSAYGATEATREAGRAFVGAATSSDASRQACTAATLALRNEVATPFDCASHLQVSCVSNPGCTTGLVPGETIRVEIDLTVGLPFLPASVFGHSLGVPVHAVHDEIVDPYRPKR
jgi:Flp pilus assembly protein TadG